MNRGAGHAPVLGTDSDKQLFIDCLVEGTTRHGVQIHGYCLMTTHYHALVLSTSGELSSAMRFVAGRFTKLKNQQDRRDGALFRGRFNSVGIETNAHLVQVSRYIHLNPVEAGLTRRSEHWPWSSAAAYLGASLPQPWLHTSELLAMFGDPHSQQSYAAYLNSGVDPGTREFYAKL